jgi:PAS domain S-box-containing protein
VNPDEIEQLRRQAKALEEEVERLGAAIVDEHLRAEAGAAARERRYRALFDAIDEGFCIIEFLDGPHGRLSDYVHIEANAAYARHTGIPNVVGQKVREMVPDEAEGWVELYRGVLTTGKPIRFERELVATGRHLELAAFRVEPASQRQVAVLFQDITARKRAEDALKHKGRELEKAKQALESQVLQKEMLLREVNHRIKNSLQIVSSILALQVSDAQDEATADALRNAAARVLAIAAVHERLYRGDDVAVVRLDTFFLDLCQDIGRSYGCQDGIRCEADRVDVPTDMAIPLALILNELVTNAVKHAGPPCRVTLRVGKESLTLTTADQGQGFAKLKPRRGMGTRIVEGLCAQLGARTETKQEPAGYRIAVTVPLPGPL